MKQYKKKTKKKSMDGSMKAPLLIASVLLIILAIYSVGFFKVPFVSGQEKKLPIYSVGTDEKKIAISFDAAWGNSHTVPILDILDRYGVKTTFFLVKFWVEKYPEDVKEICSRGHEVQNHSASHPDFTTLTSEQIMEEIGLTSDAIENITGIAPDLFRPPFGAYNNKVIETLEESGYKVIQWSVDSLDWKQISADQIVERVLSRIEPGSIVLFHNDAAHAEEYLPRILEEMTLQGYEVVPIGQLIYRENYHIDHTGKQIIS